MYVHVQVHAYVYVYVCQSACLYFWRTCCHAPWMATLGSGHVSRSKERILNSHLSVHAAKVSQNPAKKSSRSGFSAPHFLADDFWFTGIDGDSKCEKMWKEFLMFTTCHHQAWKLDTNSVSRLAAAEVIPPRACRNVRRIYHAGHAGFLAISTYQYPIPTLSVTDSCGLFVVHI